MKSATKIMKSLSSEGDPRPRRLIGSRYKYSRISVTCYSIDHLRRVE